MVYGRDDCMLVRVIGADDDGVADDVEELPSTMVDAGDGTPASSEV